jgi:ABC-2 type transport system permease protein
MSEIASQPAAVAQFRVDVFDSLSTERKLLEHGDTLPSCAAAESIRGAPRRCSENHCYTLESPAEQRIPVKGTITAVATDVTVRTSEPPRLRILPRLRELWASRQILGNLVRKEVKVKYKSSVLGLAWSMLNPILYLAVFSLVFTIVLRNRLPHFPVYLLSGLLAFNFFSSSLSLGARSVVDNGNLVTKVYFPREILPLATMGAAAVDFLTQGLVLALFMVISRYGVFGMNLLLLPLAMVALVLFSAAAAMFVSALNVRYRDTQHLLGVLMLTWFWVTPVVYPSALVWQTLGRHEGFKLLYLANPVADVVMGFQRALYGVVTPVVHESGKTIASPALAPVSVEWLALLLAAVSVGSILLLGLSWRTFFHRSGDFAEEL